MGVRTDERGQVQRGGNNGLAKTQKSLAQFVTERQADFAQVLPQHMSPERMVRLAVSAVRTTRHLDKCDLPSFASALMACSTLGLEPNTPLGHAYLIPFQRKGKYECQLIVGYKGLMDLMYRSGAVSSVRSVAVFEGDEFDYEFGLNPNIIHRPSRDPNRVSPANLTHVYPVVRLRDPQMEPIWDVLDRAQIDQRRQRSKASNNGPWVSDFIPMALKTGIRSIATWVPTSSERITPISTAVAYEEAAERGRNSQAVAALGDRAANILTDMGAFPMDESDDDEAETVETTGQDPTEAQPRTREPGEY